MKNVKTQLTNEIKSDIKNSIADQVREEVREIDNQKQRALNVIVFSLIESSKPSGTARQAEDKESFGSLCSQIGVTDIAINTSVRLSR